MNAMGRAATAVVGAILVLGPTPATAVTNARAEKRPIVLELASRDSDLGGDPAVAEFAARVERLSGGRLHIDVVGGWGNLQRGAEQQIVRDVAGGRADLGAVGTRVFDTLGVRSFQALTAPMLIDSYALERKVIASDIPTQMLPGLRRLGVSGLAVLADGLRKPVAVKRPLLGPSDWRGITFAAFRSDGAAAAIRALGARPTDVWGDALSTALAAGSVQGAENNLLVYYGNSRQAQAPYVTANVNLWPRTEALLASPRTLTKLTGEQQGWLRQAAAEAARSSTGLFDHDGELARLLCKSGAHLANASAAQLAALRTAFGSVYAALERHAQTKAFVSRIETLKRSTPGPAALPIAAGCALRNTSAFAGTGGNGAVNGTYRFVIADTDLKANGVTRRGAILENHGLYTWVLHDGRWHARQQSTNRVLHPEVEGAYTVKGDRITFTFVGGPPPATFRWRLADRAIRFTVVGSCDPIVRTLLTAHAWKKIG